jgi:hypothetical protein
LGRQHAAAGTRARLLSDDEILGTLRQFHACTRPGGLCLVSVRDYAAMERGPDEVQMYGVREEGGVRYILLQHRAFDGDHYDVTFYVVEDRGTGESRTHTLRSRYYAIPTDRLLALMRAAGFSDAERVDDAFFQPLLLGTRLG